MDNPSWAWPAWKFGMRRDDLFSSLHERYNTFTYSLQDPEAFHHDVYEIATDADTPEQFHRLMADRQQQRVRELNETLDTLAVEIIANPKLMASDQWQHALQLFRTKSFDSIVRYFASYLPDHYLDHHDCQSSSYSSFSEADSIRTSSTKASSADSALILDEDFFPDGPVVTVEPCSLDDHVYSDMCSADASSSWRSEATCSEPSVFSPSDADSHSYSSTNPPSRSMSFSGSESGHAPGLTRRSLSRRCWDATDSPSDRDTTENAGEKSNSSTPLSGGDLGCDEDDDFPAAQFPDDQLDYPDAPNANDIIESDTPTPRPDSSANAESTCCYIDHRPAQVKRMPHLRASSPKPALPCRGPSHLACDVRRSPDEALSRIQKPKQDVLRKRPLGRRRPE